MLILLIVVGCSVVTLTVYLIISKLTRKQETSAEEKYLQQIPAAMVDDIREGALVKICGTVSPYTGTVGSPITQKEAVFFSAGWRCERGVNRGGDRYAYVPADLVNIIDCRNFYIQIDGAQILVRLLYSFTDQDTRSEYVHREKDGGYKPGKNSFYQKLHMLNWTSEELSENNLQRARKIFEKYRPDPYIREGERWFEEKLISPGMQVTAVGRIRAIELKGRKLWELCPLEKETDGVDKVIIANR